MNAEQRRLQENRGGQEAWDCTVRTLRASLGHCSRRLQPDRRSLGFLPSRPRPVQGLPLE